MIPGCTLCFHSFFNAPGYILPCGHCYCKGCFDFSAKYHFPCWFRCEDGEEISIETVKELPLRFRDTTKEEDKAAVIAEKEDSLRDRDTMEIMFGTHQPELDNEVGRTTDQITIEEALLASTEKASKLYDTALGALQDANVRLTELIAAHDDFQASHRETIEQLENSRLLLFKRILETSEYQSGGLS